MTTTAETLRNELRHFTGSEQFYRPMINRNAMYTEGVQHFAEKAGAYWLLDILFTQPEIVRQGVEFAAITLEVKDDTAVLTVTDGNKHTVYTRSIKYTNCPEGTWKFFMADLVLMLCSEY